jgi:hypothetical protein
VSASWPAGGAAAAVAGGPVSCSLALFRAAWRCATFLGPAPVQRSRSLPASLPELTCRLPGSAMPMSCRQVPPDVAWRGRFARFHGREQSTLAPGLGSRPRIQ